MKKYRLAENIYNKKATLVEADNNENSNIFLNADTYEQPLTPGQVRARLNAAVGVRKQIEDTLAKDLTPGAREVQEQNLALINSYIVDLKALRSAQDIKSTGNGDNQSNAQKSQSDQKGDLDDKKPPVEGDPGNPEPPVEDNKKPGDSEPPTKGDSGDPKDQKLSTGDGGDDGNPEPPIGGDGGGQGNPKPNTGGGGQGGGQSKNNGQIKLFPPTGGGGGTPMDPENPPEIDIAKLQKELIDTLNGLSGTEAKKGALTAIGDALNNYGIDLK